MPGRLEGKVAVITGAASGIGRASAPALRRRGGPRRRRRPRRRARRKPSPTRSAGSIVHADVTDAAERGGDVRPARSSDYGGPRRLLQQRRASRRPTTTRSSTTDLDAWRRVQEVNLTSVYLCCKAGIPILLEHGGGSVINTASFVAVLGAATSQISYTASKGGVLSMSRELGVQFARQGVRVNALCPGPGEHAASAGAVRQGPRARRAAARAHPHGPLRRARGDRRRGVLPRLRRRLVHHAPARSSSTAASTPPTSRLFDGPWARPTARDRRHRLRRAGKLGPLAHAGLARALRLRAGRWRRRARARSSSRSKTSATPILDALVARLDGLVLTGGPDVDPARYGAEPHPRSQPPRPSRDERELALIGAAERRRPAGAGDLPRHAVAQRRPRRHARPAPARSRRPRRAQPDAGEFLHPSRPHRAGPARSRKPSAGTRGRCRRITTRASTASRRPVGGRMGGGRDDRGDRGPDGTFHRRRAVAPRGRRRPVPVRSARARRGGRARPPARGRRPPPSLKRRSAD